MDLHCLTMQMDSEGTKTYGYLADWKEWVSQADVLQMNSSEIQSLFKEKVDFSSLNQYVREILKAGPKIVIITLGERGVFLGYKNDDDFVFLSIPPDVKNVIDPTGCGDVFAAAFIIKYQETSDPIKSAKYANKIAGKNGQYNGTDWLFVMNNE